MRHRLSLSRSSGLFRSIFAAVAVLALAGTAAAPAKAQTAAPYVKVFVNGQPVAFDVAPVIDQGRVLVPLRGVFERLGAVVAWDASTQTVLAQQGATSVELRIGDQTAHVNGQPVSMDVPALLVGGRTMVPLRFVSQALGAAVSWNAVTTTVQITSGSGSQAAAYPPSATYGPPQVAAPMPSVPAGAVTGTVLQVNAGAYPGQVTVESGGVAYTYQVVSGTAVTRTNAATGTGGVVALSAVQPGDAVRVTADAQGTAQQIHATYREASGRVASLTDGVLTLQNGNSYRLNPSVTAAQNGQTVDVNSLRPGDQVALRLNPQTGEVWGVDVRRAAARATITSVTVTPAGRTLRAGDVLTVVAQAPPGGRAAFAIGGFRSGLPMTESATQPGTYVGTYVIQPGDYVVEPATVTVRYTGNGVTVARTAATRILFDGRAAQTPPAAPSPPIITSPAPGSTIRHPFTVTGTAAPGMLVKVTAVYAGTVLLFQVHGTLGSQVVTADRDGNWSATFTGEPSVLNVPVTITAVAVDGTGQALTQASTVTATLE